jgi:hypothetical protein
VRSVDSGVEFVCRQGQTLQVAVRLEPADDCVCQPQAFGDAFGVELAHGLLRKRR